MIIIRPISRHDHKMFSELNFASLVGMTSIFHDRNKFIQKIIHSEESFGSNIRSPGEEEYYFVLEDLTTRKKGGICAIFTQSRQNFDYIYQIETLKRKEPPLSSPNEIKILKVVTNPPDSSEVGSLYLHDQFRHSGIGRLLSFSRFLFIAAFPERFRKNIVAEMRGYFNDQNDSPFWEAIGHHFCHLTVDELRSQHDLIKEILPEYPIYISLLPEDAQKVIGKTHDKAKPAYEMLIQQNFSYHQQVDLLDGGPLLKAKTKEIHTIKSSALVEVDLTQDRLEEEPDRLLGNERLNFRACIGKIQLVGRTHALIHEEVANALMIKRGDKIRYASLH